MKKRVFLICSVRKADKEELEKAKKYKAKLEADGCEVYWPYADTNQKDPIGLRICTDNLSAIARSDEVHILWNPSSEGSKFDLGMTFAIFFLMNRIKKIVLANRAAVEKLVEEENGRGVGKSFNKVLLALDDRGRDDRGRSEIP